MISRNKLVYIGSAIAFACVVFVGGLLIGRFAIPRPEQNSEPYDLIAASKQAEEERKSTWNRYKNQFLEQVNAQEIEKNLR